MVIIIIADDLDRPLFSGATWDLFWSVRSWVSCEKLKYSQWEPGLAKDFAILSSALYPLIDPSIFDSNGYFLSPSQEKGLANDELSECKILKEKLNSLQAEVENYELLLSKADEHFEEQLGRMKTQVRGDTPNLTVQPSFPKG